MHNHRSSSNPYLSGGFVLLHPHHTRPSVLHIGCAGYRLCTGIHTQVTSSPLARGGFIFGPQLVSQAGPAPSTGLIARLGTQPLMTHYVRSWRLLYLISLACAQHKTCTYIMTHIYMCLSPPTTLQQCNIDFYLLGSSEKGKKDHIYSQVFIPI